GIADFKAAIAQKVSLIVTYPDFGDAMLPVMKEATDAGIPVATYAWGYVTGPGKNYLTVVGEYTCNLGRAFAAAMNTQVGSGDIAFLGGFPGNPLSLGWQKCEQPALNPSVHIVANEPTNWDPSKVQSVVAGILAAHPNIKGWSYEYGGGMALGAVAAYKAAGKPFNPVLTLRTDDVRMGCLYNQLKKTNPGLKMYYYTSGNSQIRVAFTAAMMKLKGARIPATTVFPIQLQNPDEGTVEIGGSLRRRGSPAEARRLGLGMAYQTYSHVLDLSVAENLYLALPADAQPKYRRMEEWAAATLEEFNLDIPLTAAAGS